MATAAHALAEAYAVLTRFPAPHRLSPADALALLDANFIDGARAVALDAEGYRSLLRRAGKEGIAGGRTYDAIIAECALKAKADSLLTFNPNHFAHIEPAGVRIVVPAGAEESRDELAAGDKLDRSTRPGEPLIGERETVDERVHQRQGKPVSALQADLVDGRLLELDEQDICHGFHGGLPGDSALFDAGHFAADPRR